jgi:hypothetical protein
VLKLILSENLNQICNKFAAFDADEQGASLRHRFARDFWNRQEVSAFVQASHRRDSSRMGESIQSLAPAERAQHYRQLATQVSELAQVASTRSARETFRQLAKSWLGLAAEVERHESEDAAGAQLAAIN